MKLLTINTIVLAVAAMLCLPSCSKYINLKPEDATYDNVFWKSGPNVQKALAGAYGGLRSAFRQDQSYFIFGDLPADEMWLDGNVWWNYTDILKDKNFHFSYAPYLEASVWNWTRFYTVINQCHLIIENTPNIDATTFDGGEAEKNQALGEAYFLRAYTYFYITRVWGDPVVTTESLKDPLTVQPVPRTPEDEALSFCIEDLKKAVELLPSIQDSYKDKTAASKGAAQTLLAQVYAWKHDYANASVYCDAVINSGDYALESGENFSQIFQGNSTESILESFMKHDDANKEGSADFFGIFLHDPLIKDKEAYVSWGPNYDLTEWLYDKEKDKRFSQTFGDYDGDGYLKKYANVDYYDPSQETVYVVDNNLVMMRYADVLLLKSEAAYKTGDEGLSLQLLNQIKERAGLDAVNISGEELWDEIMNERYREFYGEGIIAYDLIRMDQLKVWFTDQYSEERLQKKGYYWPLDMRTLLPQDPLLTQNEWWKNH
ncbi:RagB/SusD family nutrient uptake outer membrane protein [Flavihumibacter petaseus]|uniref:RagB/SusD family nutrient uptake outer membrane protein n=1 Tax=Flavihumibacter petaseus NBRC 106054 TaxID=1220578 RepID=A0A0E9MXJ8_9BACT|nr:RagB/SusD family nutrient uptake outer membrane protein [Flavihumibacter petaseus]GAO42146.1 hypothetical protein FPE01S_01_11590 [Flavihumibacter petaseus NBRC 106054]